MPRAAPAAGSRQRSGAARGEGRYPSFVSSAWPDRPARDRRNGNPDRQTQARGVDRPNSSPAHASVAKKTPAGRAGASKRGTRRAAGGGGAPSGVLAVEELLVFGRALQRGGRRVALDRRRHQVEVAGADLALV